jgi:hypothetical protein
LQPVAHLLIKSLAFSMDLLVALRAHRNQVLFQVRAALASELDVVNLEVTQGPTYLALPTVAIQNLAVNSGYAMASSRMGLCFSSRFMRVDR